MFAVLVTLEVVPEKVAPFLEGVRMQSEASLAREPGCLTFEVMRVIDRPYTFVLYETYRDASAFYSEHRSALHYPAWRQIVAKCVKPDSQVSMFCTSAFVD